MRPNAASQCHWHGSRRGHCWGKECLCGASPIGNSDRVLRRLGTGFGLCLCCDAVCGSNPHLEQRRAIPSLCVPSSVSRNSTCTGSVSVRCLCQAATGDFQGRAECFRRRLATERAGRKPIMINATCPHAHRTASTLRFKRARGRKISRTKDGMNTKLHAVTVPRDDQSDSSCRPAHREITPVLRFLGPVCRRRAVLWHIVAMAPISSEEYKIYRDTGLYSRP